MRALAITLLSLALTTTPAWASGPDNPTPYQVTPAGITFPQPLAAHGHINVRLTDGTTASLHLDPNNGHPGAAWIGSTHLPWTALNITSGCIAWVQWSGTNEHYGEGGQPPVCVTSEEPSWPTTSPEPTVPTSTAPSTPSPTTPTGPSPTTPTTTPDGSGSTTTSEPSPSTTSTPTPSSTPSTGEPSPEATTTPPTPTEDPWTTPSPEVTTPSTQPTSAPSPETPDGSTSDPSTSVPSERGTDAATPSPSASASAELPVTGPSSALLGVAGALTVAGLAAVALGRRTR